MRRGKIPARRPRRLGARPLTLFALLGALALVAAACGDSTEVTVVSIVETPGETVVVETPGETVVVTSIVEVEATTTTTEPESKGTIGFSYGNEGAGIYPIVARPAALEAERRGYDWVEGAANLDCDQQVQDIEGFIAQGVQAIVFLPLCGIEPYENVVQQAKDAGIVVVGYSTAIPGGDSSIVYANVDGARALAAEVLRWAQEDYTGDPDEISWAIFTFDQCGTACTDRTDPIKAILEEEFGPGLEAESVAADTGLEATETFLQQDPGLNIVIGINDSGALGARQAFLAQIESEGRDPGEIFVAGMDGEIEALEIIGAGDPNEIYRASAALLLDQLGQAVADLPANILEGQPSTSLVLNYVIITPEQADLANDIVANYNQFVG